jgi:HSP20 family protein
MANNLTRWDPSLLYPHRDEFVTSFDRLFDHMFEGMFPSVTKEFGVDLFSKGAYPKVNVSDEETRVLIEAEVPGLSKDQVKVEVQDGVLTIRGEKREAKDDKKKTYVYRELKQSSFARSFQLNENLDADKIDAKFENGVLEVIIPKKVPETKASQVKTIDIK